MPDVLAQAPGSLGRDRANRVKDFSICPMEQPAKRFRVSRRTLLGGGLLAGAGTAVGATIGQLTDDAGAVDRTEPFYGDHQSGISEGTQSYTILAAFDLTADAGRHDMMALLKEWTALAAKLTTGATTPVPVLPSASPPSRTGADAHEDPTLEDSMESYQLGPQRLTLTIGFGRSLFIKTDGVDRYGLGTRLPTALIELPPFEGDELVAAQSDGDLLVQACADDPQVAFHAVRSIDRAAGGIAMLRWAQPGFSPPSGEGTPRNLLGFKDGTMDSNLHPPGDLQATLWAGPDGPAWMHGGTYLVFRRIRVNVESWDRLAQSEQEEIIGRRKVDGAPLGQEGEFSPLALGRLSDNGNWWIPPASHVRVASPEVNDGAVLVRRSFSYVNGVTPFVNALASERSASALAQAPEFDAGSLFLAFQKDPRTAFIPVYGKLALIDALRRFTSHTASAVFAIPPGASEPGDWLGRRLFV
jgi:deferrochelatase/peroxidase EfeB